MLPRAVGPPEPGEDPRPHLHRRRLRPRPRRSPRVRRRPPTVIDTVPRPWRRAFSTQVAEDLVDLVRVAPDLGQLRPATSTTNRSSASPLATRPSTSRAHGRGTSTTCLCSSSRPASIRETSSSSLISRVTRSASALTVASMTFFCSSLNRSHLASSVAVKPFTLVSGERSSCATVETRSARLRSCRSRASGVAQAHDQADDPALVADVARGDQQLAHLACPVSISRRSGWPVRVDRPVNGWVQAHQSRPVGSVQRAAPRGSRGRSTRRRCGRAAGRPRHVDDDHGTRSRPATTTPSGSSS